MSISSGTQHSPRIWTSEYIFNLLRGTEIRNSLQTIIHVLGKKTCETYFPRALKSVLINVLKEFGKNNFLMILSAENNQLRKTVVLN